MGFLNNYSAVSLPNSYVSRLIFGNDLTLSVCAKRLSKNQLQTVMKNEFTTLRCNGSVNKKVE